jgi:hypothetical protein
MNIFIALAVIAVIALVLKFFNFGSTDANNTSRPPVDVKPKIPKENDKLIVVANASHQEISKALTTFCNIYNKEEYAALPRLFEIDAYSYAVTFPYDVDFMTFCFVINFLKYPMDIKWNADVKAWATTKHGDEWITEKTVNKKVMLFLANDDKEYDNVFLTTPDNIGYKLGFAAGEEVQLLNMPKERYKLPTAEMGVIQRLKFEDFQ